MITSTGIYQTNPYKKVLDEEILLVVPMKNKNYGCFVNKLYQLKVVKNLLNGNIVTVSSLAVDYRPA